jgi:hypothetical protein
MAIGPSVNALGWIAIGDDREAGRLNELASQKDPLACCTGEWSRLAGEIHKELWSETGGFNQANLIPPGREFTALIALNHHAATGLDPNDAGSNPAKGCGFKHFYDIAGL